LLLFVHAFIHSANYNGGAGCNYCNPDYDAAAGVMFGGSLGDAAKSLVAWENKFEAMLKEGRYSAFHGANKCDITIWPMPSAIVDQGDETKNLRGGSNMNAAHAAMKGRTTAE
jgi:hypothetical protein